MIRQHTFDSKKVLRSVDSHPSAGRAILVHMCVVNFDTDAISLLVSSKIFQTLPRAIPGKASNEYIVNACNVPGLDLNHGHLCVRRGTVKRSSIIDKILDFQALKTPLILNELLSL